MELPDGDEPVALEEALTRLQDPDRERRRQAAEGVTEALRPGLRTRAFVFNTLLPDKATKDRLRSYEHWLAARNLANEASDESVEALIEAVQVRYELARRWYRLKAKLLGLDRLAHYDRMAPLRESTSASPTTRRASSCSTATGASRPSWATPPPASSPSDYIDGPPAAASAAAPSAPTRSRARTPTCCSTTPRAPATC